MMLHHGLTQWGSARITRKLNRQARRLTCRVFNAANAQGCQKKKLVFLGTPDVAATVLKDLLEASRQPDSLFEVSAVISQPGKPKGRGNKSVPIPSPVEQLAREMGVAPEHIMCPATAKEEAFLTALRGLSPDLCVTAAYGNMLPQRLLDIPPLGTLNIHPSLLPRYRGAAPVQRALQDGVKETGVSVAYTVLKCDAGPVLAQHKEHVDPDIQAPELLAHLFKQGSALLLSKLPDVFEGRGPSMAVPQDEAHVLHAAKLSKEESQLDFVHSSALTLHNKVRGFAGWPGTSARFELEDEDTGTTETIDVKIIRTRVGPHAHAGAPSASGHPKLHWGADDSLLIHCGGGGVLQVLEVQPPTKKVMAVRDFRNGLRSKKLHLPSAPAALAV